MTQTTLIYILLALTALCAICAAAALISIRKSADKAAAEASEQARRIDELTRQMADFKQNETAAIQVIQNSFRTFGEMISANQRDSAENLDKRLAELNRRFSAMAVENEQKLENIRISMEKKISALTEDNNKQLEQMRQTVDEKLQKTLEDRISQSFQLVSDRLEQVYKGLGEMQNIAAGVGDLKKVLSNVKTRGILGEVQLGAILDQILSPDQYVENVVTKSTGSERVEFAVKLPGDAYSKLMDAYDTGDAAKVEEAARNLEKVIKSEAKDIRDKYIEPPYTTDFGIMFLPFEGLYAEVVRRGLLETLQRDYKVNIAGPTTMAALLNSLQMGFKTLAIQKHSSEVWNILGAVKTEFDKFGGILAKTQNRLNQANEELDKLIGTRTRSIMRKLKDVTALPEKDAGELLDIADINSAGFGGSYDEDEE